MKVQQVFDHYVKSLQPLYDLAEARNISFWIMEEKLGLSKVEILTRSSEVISEVKANQLAFILIRLMKGEPIQYILGHTFFYGMKLKVNPAVLIPRPETEELVDWIRADRKADEIFTIVDIGTGSGCLAIVLKKYFPLAEVYALDVSPDALETARENAKLQETAIHFLHHDILQENDLLPRSFPGNEISDLLIVSNPPYITADERSSLAKNVIDYEPQVALFVNDTDPLKFYRAIIRFASGYSNTREIYFEINPAYAENVSQLLREAGYTKTITREDMQGKKRMVKGAISLR